MSTDDERYVVINGRRWRATDPSIPAGLKSQLVAELMKSRRAVHRSAGDDDAVRRARRAVHDAKVALGERGHPWWEPSTAETRRPRIEATIRTLLRSRAPDKTICPSDVARVVGQPDWRQVMDAVREVAVELAEGQVLEITRRGEPVVADDPSGPVRYGAGPNLDVVALQGDSS